jgi:hypothetical protein
MQSTISISVTSEAERIATKLARLYQQPHLICDHCCRPMLLRTPSQMAKYRQHFCSRDCQNAALRDAHEKLLRVNLVTNVNVVVAQTQQPGVIGPCLLWQRRINHAGYGQISHSCGRPGHPPVGNCSGTTRAHRLAYELFVGPIPFGQTVDHVCRNRRCVNVLHMEIVTQRVNTLRGDGPSALNARKTSCPRGHAYTTQSAGRKGWQRVCHTCQRTAAQQRAAIRAARRPLAQLVLSF